MALKQVPKKLLSVIFCLLSRLKVFPRRIILRMDGGICSQMHFYLIGQFVGHKNNCEVKFDTTWYETNGMDNNGVHCRRFDLLKIFPDLDFKTENSGLFRRLLISFSYFYGNYSNPSESDIDDKRIVPPVYLDGYFHDPQELYTLWFPRIFKVNVAVLPKDNHKILEEIVSAGISSYTCAIHVRRGDLAKADKYYGNPCTIKYFVDGARFIHNLHPDVKFFIFSDDSSWVTENLKEIFDEYEAATVDINGSDRGWCDLILMSRCAAQVTSQGSMGKYAALLRGEINQKEPVILPGNETSKEWLPRFRNAIIMS